MPNTLDDFKYRRSFVENLTYDEAKVRISGFMEWLQNEQMIKSIIDYLRTAVDAEIILTNSGSGNPPQASTPEEIAAVGLHLMSKCLAGEDPWEVSHKYGIEPPYSATSVQPLYDEVMDRFIDPAIDYIQRELDAKIESNETLKPLSTQFETPMQYPLEITESLKSFSRDYPEIHRNAFVMMKFGKTKAHDSIINAIKSTLGKYGIHALRADDKQYHDDLFPNVLTYIYGCRFCIAVFERLEEDDFNPNVSLEVGYMGALKKSTCLLKDTTLKTLHTDLIGKLYKIFDPQDAENTIPPELEKWLRDKNLINI